MSTHVLRVMVTYGLWTVSIAKPFKPLHAGCVDIQTKDSRWVVSISFPCSDILADISQTMLSRNSINGYQQQYPKLLECFRNASKKRRWIRKNSLILRRKHVENVPCEGQAQLHLSGLRVQGHAISSPFGVAPSGSRPRNCQDRVCHEIELRTSRT